MKTRGERDAGRCGLAMAASAIMMTGAAGLRCAMAEGTAPVRDDRAAEKLGWQLGIQAYVLRQYTFFETVDKAASLGLKYVEVWPGQTVSPEHKVRMDQNLSPELRALVSRKLAAAGVKAVAIGVAGMSEPLCRLAQEMGITVITTETKPSDETEKLCAQYGVKMALHNHPNSWPPDQVLDACKGRGAAVGACADTGHWMRRGLNPVATLKQLEGRIVCVHLKDLNEFGGVAGAKPHDVPWGTGKGDARAMLAELHRQGFKGMIAIEYEHITPDLMADLAKCIAFFDQVAAELTAQTPPDPKPGQ